MLTCSGLPCVDVIAANGRRLRMLIDAGDMASLLDARVANELGLKVVPINRPDGTLTGYGRAVLQGVKLGGAPLGDVHVLVMDLSTLVKRNRLPKADGLLAYAAFKDRMLEMDYKTQQVRVSAPLAASVACPSFCGELSTPTFGQHGPPVVVTTGFSVNGQPVTAQVDTLFAGTMLIYPDAVAKLGLATAAKTTHEQFFPYTDGGVSMRRDRSEGEGFGSKVLQKDAPVYFATPAVHLPGGHFDATVGNALLEHSALIFDFHDMKFWLK